MEKYGVEDVEQERLQGEKDIEESRASEKDKKKKRDKRGESNKLKQPKRKD